MNKIFYNIYESEYYFKVNNLTFYFSSIFYLNKFKKEYKEKIIIESQKLELKYKAKINANELILIDLYRKIEKRGLYIIKDNKKINSIKYNFSLDYVEC